MTGQNGQTPNPAPAGAGLIGQLLTSPRPGGLAGLNGTPTAAATTGTAPAATTGQTIGGGIAGVASKREQEGIKSYKDRTKYNEWEFVYDITKDTSRTGGAVPAGAPPPGTPIGQQPGTPIGQQPQQQTPQQQPQMPQQQTSSQ
jgi:hypothetical protein